MPLTKGKWMHLKAAKCGTMQPSVVFFCSGENKEHGQNSHGMGANSWEDEKAKGFISFPCWCVPGNAVWLFQAVNSCSAGTNAFYTELPFTVPASLGG